MTTENERKNAGLASMLYYHKSNNNDACYQSCFAKPPLFNTFFYQDLEKENSGISYGENMKVMMLKSEYCCGMSRGKVARGTGVKVIEGIGGRGWCYAWPATSSTVQTLLL